MLGVGGFRRSRASSATRVVRRLDAPPAAASALLVGRRGHPRTAPRCCLRGCTHAPSTASTQQNTTRLLRPILAHGEQVERLPIHEGVRSLPSPIHIFPICPKASICHPYGEKIFEELSTV